MSEKPFPNEVLQNERTFRMSSYILVALMMACAAQTFGGLVNHVMPVWGVPMLAPIGFLVALDSLYSYRRYEQMSLLGREWLVSYATQWVVILLALKLFVDISSLGTAATFGNIPLWFSDFSNQFFNLPYVISVGMALLTWFISAHFAFLLDEMGLDQAVILQDAPELAFQEHRPARERLLAASAVLGAGLLVATALLRFDLRATLTDALNGNVAQLPPLAGANSLSTLLYFFFSLILLSQTQFLALQTRWSMQGVRLGEKIGRRWLVSAAVFLTALTAMVSILPTTYSLGFFTVLGYIISTTVSILAFIAQTILGLLIFLLGLPMALLPKGEDAAVVAPQPTPELPTFALEAINTPSNANSWLELAKSSLFWVVFIAVISLSLAQYFRGHQGLFDGWRSGRWKAVFQWWDWFRAQFKTVREEVSRIAENIQQRIQARHAAQSISRGGWLNLRRLDPRRQVYFYYLALVRRSGENGLPRRQAQTPYEYSATLESSLPENQPDIRALTESFVEARYSKKTVNRQNVSMAQQAWNRIRKAFKR